jgi:hypothetical protein
MPSAVVRKRKFLFESEHSSTRNEAGDAGTVPSAYGGDLQMIDIRYQHPFTIPRIDLTPCCELGATIIKCIRVSA